jgi:hypothetical protein
MQKVSNRTVLSHVMVSENTPSAPPPPKLLDQVRDKIRVKHYSIRTETQYLQWIKRFIFFHGKRHPRDLGAVEVEAFLSYLATEGNVSASTQNQALSALLFLYREVLGVVLPWMDTMVREEAATLAGGVESFRNSTGYGAHGRDLQFDGEVTLWHRYAVDGVLPVAGERHRLRSARDSDSRG